MRRTRITTPQARAQFAAKLRQNLENRLPKWAADCKVESTLIGVNVVVISNGKMIASTIANGVRVINELAQEYDWCEYGEVKPTDTPEMLSWTIPVNYTIDKDDRED